MAQLQSYEQSEQLAAKIDQPIGACKEERMAPDTATIHPADVEHDRLPRELAIPLWAQRAVRFIEASARAGKTVTVTADEETLTPAQMAAEIGISRASVQRRIARGEIASRKVGNRHRISRREVERFRAEFIVGAGERSKPVPAVTTGVETVCGMHVTRVLTDAEIQRALPVDLEKLRETLRHHHVAAAYLFGSRSRGTHRCDSDIDLLCVLDSEHKTIGALVELQEAVDQLAPVCVDVATDITPVLKKYVAPDLVKVL